MNQLQMTTSLLGLGLAVLILYLLRRDHLYVLHGLFWIAVAGVAALFGLWPSLLDRVANLLGISYPPALLLLAGSIVLFVKALYADILHTRLERQVRLLNQRVAILDAEVNRS